MSYATDQVGAGSVAADISNAVVRLLSEYTGRGPTKARTHIHEDLVTVVLRDTLTKGERSLVAAGKTDVAQSIESFVLEPRTGEGASAADDDGSLGASNGHVQTGSA